MPAPGHAPRSERSQDRATGAVGAASRRAPLDGVEASRAALRDVLAAGDVRRKVRVGPPGDRFEREADAVAERVVANRPAPVISSLGTRDARRKSPSDVDEEDVVQRATRSDEDEEATVQRAPAREDEDLVQRQAADEEEDDAVVQAAGRSPGPAPPSAVATRAVRDRGGGVPMLSSTRAAIESSTGVDMSRVRVHEGAAAQRAARDMNARAFTHGSDIWLGPGESQRDVRLMAHEATHVVQQQGDARRQVVQREDAGGGDSGTTADAEEARRILETFRLPPIKQRHRPVYEAWASSNRLVRKTPYDRGSPDQKDSVWLPNVNVREAALRPLRLDPEKDGKQAIDVHGHTISDTYERLMTTLKVPSWDRTGKFHAHPFEVDHIVELQCGNWSGGSSGAANTLENMELLDKRSNASAGGSTRSSIARTVREYLTASTGRAATAAEARAYLDTPGNDITFRRVVMDRAGRRAESASQWWTRREIEHGRHLEKARPAAAVSEAGGPDDFALLSGGGTVLLGLYHHEGGALEFPVEDEVQQTRVAGLKIHQFRLRPDHNVGAEGREVGTVSCEWDLPEDLSAPAGRFDLSLFGAGRFAGALGPLPDIGDLHYDPMSAISWSGLSIEGDQVRASGTLTPSIPLLGSTPIEVGLLGTSLQFSYYYGTGELQLPVPGVTIDDVTLGVFAGTAGFGAEGVIDFTIEGVATGTLAAGVDSSGGFEASGRLTFDTDLFDVAELEIWYRDRAFGGRGRLAIEQPGKVTGIRAASAEARFEGETFSAEGTVAPSIPGISEGALAITWGPGEGLRVSGSLALSEEVPGIRSGNVEATVSRAEGADGYALAATGTAQPAIPGIDSELTVSYDAGAITIEGSAAYERGMLSGTVAVGVTNRPVDEEGRPGGEPTDELRAFGGGSVTVQLTPWLAGTVGVRLLPNGEIELAGEIALPDVVEVFPEYAYDRNLFAIDLDIPIFGVAVAGQRIGIFATIGGGVDLSAGVGPGTLRDVRLGVTYNPDHEEDTHVEGGARFVIPAHAGVRLFVRGALGAGIPVVSATLGLEIGGEIGLAGAVEAGVEVDWTPAQGLVLDAVGEIYVEPKFRFDLTGFAKVEADLWLTTIDLYSRRWELAAFEFGPDLRLGMRLPIHYAENEPFEVAWSDVEFDVPEIEPMRLLRGLVGELV